MTKTLIYVGSTLGICQVKVNPKSHNKSDQASCQETNFIWPICVRPHLRFMPIPFFVPAADLQSDELNVTAFF